MLGKHGCRISQDSRRDDCDVSLSHLPKEMYDVLQPIRRATPSSPSLKLGTIHKIMAANIYIAIQKLSNTFMSSYFNFILTSVFKSDKIDIDVLVFDEQYQETLK